MGVVTCERPTDVHFKKDVKSVINIYALLSDDVATVLTTLIQTYCKDKFARFWSSSRCVKLLMFCTHHTGTYVPLSK